MPGSVPSKFIAATNFLAQLDPNDRKTMLGLADRSVLRKGQFIYRTGDRDRRVYILLQGRVKVFKESMQGREVILWFCFAGEIFGMSEVHSAKGRRASVQACEEVHLGVLSERVFDQFLERRPSVSRICRRVMSARLGMLSHVLVNVTADDAQTRIAKLLLHLSARYGIRRGVEIHLRIYLTHQEIANLIGVNRQTTSRVLGDFRRAGLLVSTNRHICIRDEDQLNVLASKAA